MHACMHKCLLAMKGATILAALSEDWPSLVAAVTLRPTFHTAVTLSRTFHITVDGSRFMHVMIKLNSARSKRVNSCMLKIQEPGTTRVLRKLLNSCPERGL